MALSPLCEDVISPMLSLLQSIPAWLWGSAPSEGKSRNEKEFHRTVFSKDLASVAAASAVHQRKLIFCVLESCLVLLIYFANFEWTTFWLIDSLTVPLHLFLARLQYQFFLFYQAHWQMGAGLTRCTRADIRGVLCFMNAIVSGVKECLVPHVGSSWNIGSKLSSLRLISRDKPFLLNFGDPRGDLLAAVAAFNPKL